jgi:hypothetical protein
LGLTLREALKASEGKAGSLSQNPVSHKPSPIYFSSSGMLDAIMPSKIIRQE